ncbi:PIR protein [Plasmodium malariae]|uniref:PIR protein n=1 Tax=Plasmodium malariae TaxID=5858 RepID=A0A1D3JHL0_PLAMA|nr:PIR protein [Plasmodium malariae]XP_028859161.1 PIR protein [Plasmodium malariae]SBT85603.1 PIR protein [Plasmodium malariae]SBT85882.1 PIR protein [Plasmodium malariae]
MASGVTVENDNCVELFLRYKDDFDKTIQDFNDRTTELNPGSKCATILKHDNDFTEPCQEIGAYLMKIQKDYFSERIRRCKYLNYWINNKEKYNKLSSWFNGYNEFSSKLGHICEQYIKQIDKTTLTKFNELYDLYEKFNNFIKNVATQSVNCQSAQGCYDLYIRYYIECEESNSNEFCEELNNFREAYNKQMINVTACPNVPRILEPKKNYVFFASLTTLTVLIATFTLFLLYKFTPIKSWLYSRLQRKKIIQLIEVEEKKRESLVNTCEEVSRNYEESFHNVCYQPQGVV